MIKYTARSASDKTDDWPLWMVWDGTRNVTADVMEDLWPGLKVYNRFLPKELAEKTAELANERLS